MLTNCSVQLAVNPEAKEKLLEFLRKYILYCRRFNPILSDKAGAMIVQFYANIVAKPGSYVSPRLFDTLTALCFAVARLRQKNIIDVEDVKEVTGFYNVQLQHLTQAAAEIPKNPIQYVREKVIKVLDGSLIPRKLTELVAPVQKTDVFVRESLQLCLQDTLKNFKDKLHGANPSVLWSGGGYHILQPLDADVILEMESIFAKFNEPSRGLMKYAEIELTNGRADSNHSSNVSFGNCMVRIPGSYNTKYIQFDDNDKIVNIPPKSEVKIVQPWNCYKPNIRWLLNDYWKYLIQEKNNEVLNGLRKDQKRLRSQWRRGIDPNQCQQSYGS